MELNNVICSDIKVTSINIIIGHKRSRSKKKIFDKVACLIQAALNVF